MSQDIGLPFLLVVLCLEFTFLFKNCHFQKSVQVGMNEKQLF